MEKLSKILRQEKKEIKNGMLDFSKIGREVRENYRMTLYLKLINSGKLHINK